MPRIWEWSFEFSADILDGQMYVCATNVGVDELSIISVPTDRRNR